MARALNPPFSGWRHLTHIHTPYQRCRCCLFISYTISLMGLLKLDSFSTQLKTNTNESQSASSPFGTGGHDQKLGKLFFTFGQSCWGPLKQTIQVLVNMARTKKEGRKGGCDFKARSDKKENCTEPIAEPKDPTQTRLKTILFFSL